jgi:hypothetical protein
MGVKAVASVIRSALATALAGRERYFIQAEFEKVVIQLKSGFPQEAIWAGRLSGQAIFETKCPAIE